MRDKLTIEGLEASVTRRNQLNAETMRQKGREYAGDGDRLRNFESCARLQASGATREAAMWNQVIKHLVAIRDAIDEIPSGEVRDDAFWDEKIGDVQVFMHLIEASVRLRTRPSDTGPVSSQFARPAGASVPGDTE